MNLSAPELRLYYIGDALESGHPSNQAVGVDYLIRNSFRFQKQLLNGLKSSSNKVELTIASFYPYLEDIISYESDIKAVLIDGSQTLFTGYVSSSYSWTVTNSGERNLAITLEDCSVRLLSKNFIESGYHLFNTTLTGAVNAVCQKAGIESAVTAEIPIRIIKTVEASVSCRDILSQICYECGYAYYCDNEGKLRLFKIDCENTSGAIHVTSDNLYSGISLSKKARQYKGARISYKEIGEASNYLVYSATEGQDSGHPYCNFIMNGGEVFDGLEKYTEAEWSEITADQFREPAMVEAVNAASETNLVGSNEILAVSNPVLEIMSTPMGLETAVAAHGNYLEMTVMNPSFIMSRVTRLQIKADVIYVKSDNVIRTASESTITERSNATLEEDLEYIHDRSAAQTHANLVSQYYRFCGQNYTFTSDIDIEVGSLVRLDENRISGLDVIVLVYSKTSSDSNSLFGYSAVSISVFDLNREAYFQSNSSSAASVTGKSAYVLAVEAGFTGTLEEWLASLKAKDQIVEYSYGESTLIPPETGWYSRAEAAQVYTDYIITLDGEDVTLDGSNVIFASEIDGKYLWQRQSNDDGLTWLYIRLTGAEGNPGKFKNEASSLPDDAEVNDYFIASDNFSEGGKEFLKGSVYVRKDDGWEVSNDSTILLSVLKYLSFSNKLQEYKDSEVVSWFSTLVAEDVIAEKVRANNAFFQDIEVTGKSTFGGETTFEGTVITKAFSTVLETVEETVITGNLDGDKHYRISDIYDKWRGTWEVVFINSSNPSMRMSLTRNYIEFTGGGSAEFYSGLVPKLVIDRITDGSVVYKEQYTQETFNVDGIQSGYIPSINIQTTISSPEGRIIDPKICNVSCTFTDGTVVSITKADAVEWSTDAGSRTIRITTTNSSVIVISEKDIYRDLLMNIDLGETEQIRGSYHWNCLPSEDPSSDKLLGSANNRWKECHADLFEGNDIRISGAITAAEFNGRVYFS